jgi:long-chain fatty acid transport protein
MDATAPVGPVRIAALRRAGHGGSMTRISVGAAAAVGLALLLLPAPARAGGFAVRDTSAESVGMATAGNGSRADDLDTVFNNPAGMTYFDGNQVELGLLAVHTNIDFSGSDTLAGTPVTGLMGNGGRFGGVPNIYAIYGLSDRLKAGLAITAPFGLLVKYNQPWIGRYLGIEGNIATVDINPNLAYRVSDWLSVGGGVSAQYLKGILATSIDQAAILGAPGTPDADARLDVSDWAFGYNLGILVQPLPGTRIGLTYRSKLAHQQRGTFEYSDVAPALGPAGLGVLVSDRDASEDFALPATIGFSVTQQVTPAWSLSADLVRTQWSTLKQVNITDAATGISLAPPLPSGFRDTWSVAVGANYRLNERWTLRGGVGWDQTPVTDAYRAVFLPDQSRITIGIGAGYKYSESLTVEFAYGHFFAAGNTPITGSVNSVDQITGSVLKGNYDVSLDEAALSARIRF